MSGLRQLTRALSDGTGLSQEEIVLLVAAAAVGTAVIGLLRTLDALKEVFPRAARTEHRSVTDLDRPTA
jgi:alkylhydroperoxidase/carboxymuconolactone decarboxylase family protein YurZ